MKRPLMTTVLLASSMAHGDPREVTVTFAAPGVTVTIPAGFERQALVDPSPDLLATYRRDGGEGPLKLQLVRLGAEVAQHTLSESELAALRGSDPCAFIDVRERARTLGFDVDALAGRTTLSGHSLVRFATVVPLADDGVMVVVMAPASREREARDVFRQVLASAHGRTSWRTPWERTRDALQRASAALALGLMAVYAGLALTVFRASDRWRGARATVMFVIGASWVAVGVFTAWGRWWVLARSLALGAVFIRHGWRMRRR